MFRPHRPGRRCPGAFRRTRLSVQALEDRLTPAVFNIPTGDTAALIAAVNAVNTNNQPDTINLASGSTYMFTAEAVAGQIDALPQVVLDGGNPANSVTINGNGAILQRSTVAGGRTFRLLSLIGADTTLNDLTITNGDAFFQDGEGGGLKASNLTLTLNRCRFVDNHATYFGGGLFIEGAFRLTVTDCAFLQNRSGLYAGGLDIENFGPGESSAVLRGTLIEANAGGLTSRGAGGVSVWNTSLTMSNCVVRGNSGRGSDGGGLEVFNDRPVATTIADCVVTDNTGEVGGGTRMTIQGGTPAQVMRTTISNNRATGSVSGAGAALISGPADFTNCTIDGNLSRSAAAITFLATGPLGGSFASCTITNNHGFDASSANGGIGISPSVTVPPVLRNTVVAGNGTNVSAGDITGRVVSLGYNFIGNGTGASITGASTGDRVGTAAAPLDPRLGPLQDNGGPTPTRLPLPASPLINSGDPAVAPPDTDQRGRPRLQRGQIDVGATETQVPRVQSLLINGGAAQRSRVTTATVIFDSAVTLPATPADAFRLTRVGPGAPAGDVTLTVDLSASTTARTVAMLTFSGPLTEFGSLMDGNYTLTIFAQQFLNQITDEGGFILDGDHDGAPGGDYVTNLYRLFGDASGDGLGDKSVSGSDLTIFRGAFGTTSGDTGYLSYLDFNGDGVINGTDLAEFRKRFGVILP